MNSKELIFLVLLTAATGFAGYSWYQDRQAAPKPAAAKTTVTPTNPEKPIPPNKGLTPPKPTNPADQEQVGARHILIQYQGSAKAKPEITRTKEEAKALAEQVLKEAQAPGADFAALAGKYSEEPNAAQRGGDLGMFTRTRMVKPFSDAAFALKPGEIAPNVVETQFGFHVIQRTK